MKKKKSEMYRNEIKSYIVRAGTTFGQNGTQKSQVKFKPCEISEKTTHFMLLSIPRGDVLNSVHGTA